MRIPAKQLGAHLKQELAPLYLVFGEEPLQRMEAIETLRQKANQQGYLRLRFEVTAQFDWENFKVELNSLNLFSEKRLIECHLAEGKVGKIGAEALTQILKPFPPEVVFLFIFSDKLDTAVAKSVWFTTLERMGISVVASPIPQSELKAWLKRRCAANDLIINDEAIDCLQTYTEGNLLASGQAIEKLKFIQQDDKIPIQVQDILNLVGVDTHFSLFEFADAVLSGSPQRTIQVFTSLRDEGIELILILWVLTREVRNIIPLARLALKGPLTAQAVKEQGVWQHRVPLVTAFLKRCPLSNLHSALIRAQHIDGLIKNNQQIDGARALLSLSLMLTGAIDV